MEGVSEPMERIEEYVARQDASLIGATPVGGPEAILADLAAEAVTSADAREWLRTLADASRLDQPVIGIHLTEGADGANPALRMAVRLRSLGYLSTVSVLPPARLQARRSDRVGKAARERLSRFTQQNRWLEAAAAGQVARVAAADGLDIDLVVNARVEFRNGDLREIDVMAVAADAVVAIEVKSGEHPTGAGRRFAEVVERLGLARSQGILLAPSVCERAVGDLAAGHAITASDGHDIEGVIAAALAVPRLRSRADPDPAEVEAVAIEVLASVDEPVTLASLIRLVRDELSTSRPSVQPVLCQLAWSGRLLGTDGALVAHFNTVVVRIVHESEAA